EIRMCEVYGGSGCFRDRMTPHPLPLSPLCGARGPGIHRPAGILAHWFTVPLHTLFIPPAYDRFVKSVRRVLVIEDDPKTAAVLEMYLRDAGYRTNVAKSGDEGLERARGE